jgi:uncharacterized cupin superfamily protein
MKMATILKSEKREFQEEPNKIDCFRLFSDVSRKKNGINPRNLNFDLRLLNPGQFSAPYHFHRFAEELFMILSGSLTLRTPNEFQIVSGGDLVFFEMGETGAHQFYNHTSESCTYLDIRTYIGFDVCEYPDSGKILIAPSFKIFNKESHLGYFEGEKDVLEKWNNFKNKTNET